MLAGARIFDTTQPHVGERRWRWLDEQSSFAGPGGRFFSDGRHLYSTEDGGLSIWDLDAGARTGRIDDFAPTHHHRRAKVLAQYVRDAHTLALWGPTE